MNAFEQNDSNYFVHSALLVTQYLIMHADKFLSFAQYEKISSEIYKMREKKDQLVRITVIQILPYIAQYKLKNFMQELYYKKVIDFLLNLIYSKSSLKGHAFYSLSRISTYMEATVFKPYCK